MMMNKKLKIALDVDDVLYWCIKYAVELEAEKGNIIDYSTINSWGKTGTSSDVIFEHFKNPDFYKTQPLIDGAKDFVKALIDRGLEVIILTAVDPDFSTIRAKRIINDFPEIPPENIIMGKRKDLVDVDILIDDAAHNITDTPAKYPICMRRPWNQHLTGLISVYNYKEALAFIDRISAISFQETKKSIYCLVGPSCSGKTTIAKELAKYPSFAIPRSTTTRAKRPDEEETAYNFVTSDEFDKLYDQGYFIETTVYANNRYGTTNLEIEKIINAGKSAVIPIDFCGANALKMKYGNACSIVYIKRSKDALVGSLLNRMENQLLAHPENSEMIKADIKNRLLSLNSERKNEETCDSVLLNNKDVSEAIRFFF